MKVLLALFIMLMEITAVSQTVRGTIIDKKTLKPIPYGSVIEAEKNIKCMVDTLGRFELEVGTAATIRFSSIGYADHVIENIEAKDEIIDLGNIYIIDAGWWGYVSHEKKTPFFQKA